MDSMVLKKKVTISSFLRNEIKRRGAYQLSI
jgi:hypothetical protein